MNPRPRVARLAAGVALAIFAAGPGLAQTEPAPPELLSDGLSEDPFVDAGSLDAASSPFAGLDDGVEELVIRGQRSGASAQSQAIAISAFNQEALDQLGVSDVMSLQTNVPSLHIGRQGTQGVITLRGVGFSNVSATGEQGVYFVQDGIPLGRSLGALGNFYDVRALEVYRGPQGTQGGRNTSGGWIVADSAPPTPDLSVQADYQVGTYNEHIWRGVLNVPIVSDRVLSRTTVRFEDRDGYQRRRGRRFEGILRQRTDFYTSDDTVNAHDLLFRTQLRVELDSGIEIRGIYQHTFTRSNGPGTTLLEDPAIATEIGRAVGKFGPPGSRDRLPVFSTDPRVTYSDVDSFLNTDTHFATLILEKDIASERFGELEFRAQVGYVKSSLETFLDLDGTDSFAININSGQEADQYSAELRLGTVDQRPWEWYVGFFFFDETNDSDSFLDNNGLLQTGDAGVVNSVRSRSIAGYAGISYWLADALRLSVGLRVLSDLKDFESEAIQVANLTRLRPISEQASWNAVTPKLEVEYEPRPGNKIGFNITNGFKNGGFPTGVGCSELGDCDAFTPEEVWQYEINSKNDFFDDRLRINATLFHTQYDPYQVCFRSGIAYRCFEGGSATIRGFELEVVASPVPELQITGNFNLLDARIDGFRIPDPSEPIFLPDMSRNPLDRFPQELSGNRLERAPKYNLNLGISYDVNTELFGFPSWGTITPRIQYTYQSRTYFRVFNLKKFSQPRYSKVDVRLSWSSPSQRWTAEAFVLNLTDVDVLNNLRVAGSVTGSFSAPRTAGIRIGFNY